MRTAIALLFLASVARAETTADHIAKLNTSYCFEKVPVKDLLENMDYCLHWPSGLQFGENWTQQDQCDEAYAEATAVADCMSWSSEDQ